MDALATVAERFLRIAGLSGIVVALSGASVASDPLDRFRIVSLLLTTLGGPVFWAVPIVLNDTGIEPERVLYPLLYFLCLSTVLFVRLLIVRSGHSPEA